MAVAELEATHRTTFGKNEMVRMRREGKIPAVLYGGAKKESQSVAVDPKALMRILHSQAGLNSLIGLKLEGAGDTRVLVKSYQLHPMTHKLLHVDFFRVAMDKVIRVTVPIHLTGEAKGVKAQGGVVDFVNRDIVIECLPGDIPEHITVDITELMLHDGVRVRDLQTGGKWKPVSDAAMMIVHVTSFKEVAAPAPDAAAAAATAVPAEPEVIKKGKIEKEGEEGAEKAAPAKPEKAEKAEKKK